MKELNAVLIVFVLMAFTTNEVEKNETENKGATLKIQKSISEFQEIIIQKKLEVQSFETKAEELTESNTEAAIRMEKRASLLKMNCLKYKAAIVCLQRHLE